uniref:Uncharacterized protein n=1 Tax=Rhizophora mucronata TaxID=61149 RepID=A0A2P2PNH9_RHIMU
MLWLLSQSHVSVSCYLIHSLSCHRSAAFSGV